jgi:hypothetical protein
MINLYPKPDSRFRMGLKLVALEFVFISSVNPVIRYAKKPRGVVENGYARVCGFMLIDTDDVSESCFIYMTLISETIEVRSVIRRSYQIPAPILKLNGMSGNKHPMFMEKTLSGPSCEKAGSVKKIAIHTLNTLFRI